MNSPKLVKLFISGLACLTTAVSLVGCAPYDDSAAIERLECSYSGNYSWKLVVESSGSAKLTVGRTTRDLNLQEKLSELRVAFDKFEFSTLPRKIGSRVPSGSTRTIKCKQGGREKTVTIHFIQPDKENEASRRANRLWNVLSGCFEDKDVHDSRLYDWEIAEPTDTAGSNK